MALFRRPATPLRPVHRTANPRNRVRARPLLRAARGTARLPRYRTGASYICFEFGLALPEVAAFHGVVQGFLGNTELRHRAIAHITDLFEPDRARVVRVRYHAPAKCEEIDAGIQLRRPVLAPGD